jgi:hypothetical protein
VEDWEQFFVEKSRRRAEKDRIARRRKRRTRRLIVASIFLVLIGSLVALYLARSEF